jgi:hypothetical protein
MAREILIAHKEGVPPARFLLDVFHDGERWTSTLARLNDAGEPQTGNVAPRFYGLTAAQARRRMITVLEHEWDEVVPADRPDETAAH